MSRHWSPRCLKILGLGLSIAPLLLTSATLGCKSEKEPLTSATSKFEVADDSEEQATTEGSTSDSSSQIERPTHSDTVITESPTLSELDQAVAQAEPDETPITPPNRNAGSGRSRASNDERSRTASNDATEDVRSALGSDSENQGSDGSRETDDGQEAPPVVSQESLESLTPPEGPPEAIWDFIVRLDQRKPRGRTDREIIVDIQRIMAARIQAAEMILQNAKAPANLRRSCVDVKLTSLQTLVQMGIPEAKDHLLAFSQSIRRDRDPEISGMGRLLSFTMLVNTVLEGQMGEAEPIVAAAQQLLKEEPDDKPNEQMLTQVATAAVTLMDAGFKDEGKEIANLVHKEYSGSGIAKIDGILANLADETHFQDLDLPTKLQEFAEDKEGSLEPLVEGTREYLKRPNPNYGRLQRAQFIGEALERKQQMKAAKDIFELIMVAFENSPDPQLVEVVKETTTYADRRRLLLDNPLTVEGKLPDGSDLNWSDYQNKIVFVTFWTAGNFQYLQQEMQALKALLDTYRDQGFAIVSINVDEDRALVTRFLQFQPLPWPTVLDGSDGKRQMMNKCGVSSVPFNLIVDQNGNVIEIHASAQSLQEKLVSLLGSPDTSPPDGRDGATEQTGSNDANMRTVNTSFVGLAVFDEPATANDDAPATKDESTEEQPKANDTADADKPESNPYLAPSGLDRAALAEFLLKMQEKPKSIRSRPGFDEALLDAAERILSGSERDPFQTIAIEVKLQTLHRRAILEQEGAEDQLWQYVQSLQGKAPEKLAREVEMLSLEHALVTVDELPIEQVPALLDRSHTLLADTKLEERHLRLASAIVHAINRLDVKVREDQFQRFGTVFSKSADRRLASYGRRIAETPTTPNVELVGQNLELAGATALGVEFDWSAYRGKVVLVDFWATWCGPCRTEMPVVKTLWEKYRDRGFDVVGVNLDRNVEQLSKYLDEQSLPWNQLVGDGARDAAERYEIQGIPTMALVDREGKVVAVSHSSTELIMKIEELLQ